MVKAQVESQARAFPPTHLPAHLSTCYLTHAPTALCAQIKGALFIAHLPAPHLPAPPPTPPTPPLDFSFLAHVVRDLSHTSLSIAPADYSSWHDVRTELMSEAKSGFKARVEAELAAAGGENLDELKMAFQQEERAIEHSIDHEVSARHSPTHTTTTTTTLTNLPHMHRSTPSPPP